MKIPHQPPQTAGVQQAEQSTAKAQTGAARRKKGTADAVKGDTVQLSSSPDAALAARQAEQAERVREIKELVKSGKYKVDARDVAEKMVSGSSRR